MIAVQIGEQLVHRQELAHGLADHRRPAEAAADQHLEAELAVVVLLQHQADIVRRTAARSPRRARDRDLELARQVGKFRMQVDH